MRRLAWTTLSTSLAASFSTLLLFPANANAQAVAWSVESDGGETSSDIIGGEVVDTCVFPATVAVRMAGSLCTASLVHPEIIISAGHCYDGGIQSVVIGESAQDSRQIPVEYCVAHPSWTGSLGDGVDYSYCKLSSPVNDVPIIPPLMGCEIDVLKPGTTVYPVGYGRNQAIPTQQGAGTKRWVATPFQGFIGGSGREEAEVGTTGKQGCMGDSGGPVYVELPEDEYGAGAGWRVFGVTSYGDQSCADGTGTYGVMWNFVEFVEEDSGFDITPCHDADGTWNPGPDCQGVQLDPLSGGGSWNPCDPGPVGGKITSCGSNGDETDTGEESGSDSTTTTEASTSTTEDSSSDELTSIPTQESSETTDDPASDSTENESGSSVETGTTSHGNDHTHSGEQGSDSASGETSSDASKSASSDDSSGNKATGGGGCMLAPTAKPWWTIAGLFAFAGVGLGRRRRHR